MKLNINKTAPQLHRRLPLSLQLNLNAFPLFLIKWGLKSACFIVFFALFAYSGLRPDIWLDVSDLRFHWRRIGPKTHDILVVTWRISHGAESAEWVERWGSSCFNKINCCMTSPCRVWLVDATAAAWSKCSSRDAGCKDNSEMLAASGL